MGQRLTFRSIPEFATIVQDTFRTVEPIFRCHFPAVCGYGLTVALGWIYVKGCKEMVVPLCMVPVGDLAAERYFLGYQYVLGQLDLLNCIMSVPPLNREYITAPTCQLGGAVIGEKCVIAAANVGPSAKENLDPRVAEVIAILFLVVIGDLAREQAVGYVILPGRSQYIAAFCEALDVLGYPSS